MEYDSSIKDDIAKKIVDMISNYSDCKKNQICKTTSLWEFGADSLDINQLRLDIEDEFEIEIPEKEYGNVVTVGDVIDLVNRKIKER